MAAHTASMQTSNGVGINQQARKQNLADLVDADFDLTWTIGSVRFRNKHRTAPTLQPTDLRLFVEF